MTTPFAVSWDYRCPFARNAHEHLVEGIRSGAEWDVTFVPFSLNQVHVQGGDPDVWDDPTKSSSLLATEVGIAVRDRFPDRFLDVHLSLFAARHDRGQDIRDEAVLREVLRGHGVDDEAVFSEIEDGWPREVFRKEHEAAAAELEMWGVPTFVVGDRAAFVRLMHRPEGDGAVAVGAIERVVGLLGGFPELNEFKHTSLSH